MGGGGIYRAAHPSQVTIYNKHLSGWANIEERSSTELSVGENFEADLDYLRNDGQGLNVSIVGERNNSIFHSYLLEARDSADVSHIPPHNDSHGRPSGEGIVMYGLTDTSSSGPHDSSHDLFAVRNPVQGNGHVTLDPNAGNGTVEDPDTGLKFEVVSAGSQGARVRVEQYDPNNINGVNVYAQVECEYIEGNTSVDGDCDALLNSPSETPPEDPLVELRAETGAGVVGMKNGTVVNKGDGSVLVAGQVQKVFVDGNASAQYVVETSDVLNESAVTLNLTTQTVVWTDNGTRTASELDTQTVEPGESVTPELARLELGRSAWDAGQHRTLEGNETTVTVRNTGIKQLENVSVRTDSGWLAVNETAIGSLEPAENTTLGVAVDVPGGAPVGNYTFNLTVTANGTQGRQNETVRVTVEVLPTVRWNATPASVDRDLAYTNETMVDVTVTTDASSNVPLRDVVTTVTGNVTRLNVTAPAPVETVQPGESATLTTTVQVPDGGIAEGSYDGLIRVDAMQHYQRYFEYPISVPDDYVVPDDEFHRTNVTVEAHGPSVDSTASFHPKRQVAMRKGSTTMTVSVEPVSEQFEPPAEAVTVRAEIPDGWDLQGNSESAYLSVWVVETNDAGKEGRRTKLDADDYEVTTTDDALVVTIPDVRRTEFGAYLTTGDRLAFDVTLNEDPKADDTEYESTVDAQTRSPWKIYRYERPAAAIDIFDLRPGTAADPVSKPIDRVPGHGVRVDADGTGVNATLTNPRQISLTADGQDTWWLAMDLQSDAPGKDQQVVWLPLDGYDGSFEGRVTEDGYLVVEGYAAPTVHAAAASGMKAASPVTIQLPADANLSAGSTVTVEELQPTGSGTNTTVVFETPAGTPAATVNASVQQTGDDTTVRIPAVVGRQLADRDDESGSTADSRSITRCNVQATG